MKKSYKTLSTVPLSIAPECEVLAGSIKMLKSDVTVEAYQDGFTGIEGAVSGLGGASFSEIEF